MSVRCVGYIVTPLDKSSEASGKIIFGDNGRHSIVGMTGHEALMPMIHVVMRYVSNKLGVRQ
jgi:hypothetical protein